MEHITSLKNPKVAAWKALKDRKGRRESGCFLVEGRKMVEEALASAFDVETVLVQEGMDRLMHGRTTFVIAHRLSTVRNADCIMVLEQGRIIERGTRDQLIAEKGRYYQLYTGKPAEKAV